MKRNWFKYTLIGICFLMIFGLASSVAINAEEEEKKDEMESVKQPKKASETGGNDQATVSIKRKYYGVEMNSDHIVFVIDVTGSMSRPLSGEVIEQAKKIVGTVTGESTKLNPKNQPRKQGENIDWEKIKNHLDLAKAELIEAIKSLDSKIFFTVIKYSTTVSVVEGSFGSLLMPATEANKLKVIEKIEKIQPSGGTDAFFDALLKAIEYGKDIKDSKKGDKEGKKASVTGDKEEKEEPKKAEPKKELPYEIFFLTDGAPTIESGNVIMPDEKINANLKKLAEALEKKNIIINTIGIGDHFVQLMEVLAKMSGGQYVNLGPKKKDPGNNNNNPQK
jgi:hypothetical protein